MTICDITASGKKQNLKKCFILTERSRRQPVLLFECGLVVLGEKVFVYYGADNAIGLAIIDYQELKFN
jgi:predicted GH43/DUF377 family glycosyl hydrolase